MAVRNAPGYPGFATKHTLAQAFLRVNEPSPCAPRTSPVKDNPLNPPYQGDGRI